MKKISFILVAVIIVGIFSPTASASIAPFTYEDINEGDWYYESVYWAFTKGIAEGTTLSKWWEPNSSMTRAMYISVLARVARNLGEDVWSHMNDEIAFTDVETNSTKSWYSYAVKWAVANKIINGTSETTFSPHDAITREQMAVMLYNLGDYMDIELPKQKDIEICFDDGEVSEWANEAFFALRTAGVFQGYEDGTVRPKQIATRAEGIKLLYTHLEICEVELEDVKDEVWVE